MNSSATRPSASSRATRRQRGPVVPQGPVNRPSKACLPDAAARVGTSAELDALVSPALHLGRHQPGPPDRRAGRNARGVIEHGDGHRRWMRRITGGTALRTVPLWRKACPKPLLRQPPLPYQEAARRRPELVSEINVTQPTPVRGLCDGHAMGHLLGYARVSTTDQHPNPKWTPLNAPAATGSSPRPPAAPAATDPVWSSFWTSCAPAIPWSSGNSTASAAPSGIWSTPSPDSPTVASGSAVCRRRSTPPPPAASSSSTSLAPWPSSNATSSANAPPPGWRPPGPGVAVAADRRC
jgi:hypothetical protein